MVYFVLHMQNIRKISEHIYSYLLSGIMWSLTSYCCEAWILLTKSVQTEQMRLS